MRKAIWTGYVGSALLVLGMATSGFANGDSPMSELDELRRIIEQQQAQLDNQAMEIKKLKEQMGAEEGSPVWVKSSKADVNVELYGQVNRAVLWADNDDSSDTYFVDNDNSSSRMGLKAEVFLPQESKVGARIEYEFQSNASNDVSQFDTTGASDLDLSLRHADLYWDNKTYGKVYLGRGSTSTDGIAEIDLSGTSVVGYADIQATAGSIYFSDGSPVTEKVGDVGDPQVKDVFSDFDGPRQDRIRYDTPKWHGLYLSGSAYSGDGYDAGLWYSRDYSGTKVAAGVGWLKFGDSSGSNDQQYVGSASMLFDFGFNVTLAYGVREFEDSTFDDADFYYGKLGYQTDIFEFGKTAFAVDYGYNEDVSTRFTGSEASAWSLQAVQNVPNWSTEFYLMFRQFDLETDEEDYENINTVFGGARLKF